MVRGQKTTLEEICSMLGREFRKEKTSENELDELIRKDGDIKFSIKSAYLRAQLKH